MQGIVRNSTSLLLDQFVFIIIFNAMCHDIFYTPSSISYQFALYIESIVCATSTGIFSAILSVTIFFFFFFFLNHTSALDA